jgi:hypothetical protein
MKKKHHISYAGLRPGDVIFECLHNVVVVEREVPEAPARVVSHVVTMDDPLDTRSGYVRVPWGKGQDVTVILGKDELPKSVAYAVAWYLALEAGGEPACVNASMMAHFIRSRWGETFK